MLTEQEKGSRKISKGTNDLLYINSRTEITEVKCRKKNLAMAWISFKKAYGRVIIDSL